MMALNSPKHPFFQRHIGTFRYNFEVYGWGWTPVCLFYRRTRRARHLGGASTTHTMVDAALRMHNLDGSTGAPPLTVAVFVCLSFILRCEHMREEGEKGCILRWEKRERERLLCFCLNPRFWRNALPSTSMETWPEVCGKRCEASGSALLALLETLVEIGQVRRPHGNHLKSQTKDLVIHTTLPW